MPKLPRIRIKLAPAGYPFTDISGADPEDWKANRGVPGIRLTPDMAPREMVVTHKHLTNLIRNPHVDIEILEKGDKPPKADEMKPKEYDYPWEEEIERKAAEARQKQEDEKFAAQYRDELDKVRAAAESGKNVPPSVIPAQNRPPPKPTLDEPVSRR